jgi:16S rRNA (adenine1518-N6/adenine1519-N6)-dimethyltransferase
MPIDQLPSLREVIAAFAIDAKKSLGQNFLFDLNLTSKIARSAGPLDTTTVIEIGPGPGGLTRALLAEGAKHVIAIERDQRCRPALDQISGYYPGRLTIIEDDALKIEYPPMKIDGDIKIVANLPYNIGTELLIKWIAGRTWPPFYSELILMFQKEVAERIVATPEQRQAYGRLGVLCGWRTEAKILFDVPPSAFTPPPKITSSVVRLTPRATPLVGDVDRLARVTQAAFGQRRKMLRQSLKSLGVDAQTLLEKTGIDPQARAETLNVDDFIALANALP